MKHPFWIINSSLFFLALIALGFISLSRTPIPERESIKPRVYVKPKKEVLQINIAKIYENDLFGTYKKEIPTPTQPDYLAPFPEPPEPQIVSVPELPAPQFLDPLNITLKGIIIVSTDSRKNRTIIEDSKTKQEALYKVGDTIEDAHIIRILSNKVIMLRSNGQQEVLYLREQDAKTDPAYSIIDEWDAIIQKMSAQNYLINPIAFAYYITNLGQFIDLLGLITAYKQGISIGCKIGLMDEKSFGPKLGLRAGDIILTINNIPATDTENRLLIYKQIVEIQQNAIINVVLLRNNKQQELTYTLKEFSVDGLRSGKEAKPVVKQKEKEAVTVLKKGHQFAPTLKEIRRREKKNMFKHGRSLQQKSSTIKE